MLNSGWPKRSILGSWLGAELSPADARTREGVEPFEVACIAFTERKDGSRIGTSRLAWSSSCFARLRSAMRSFARFTAMSLASKVSFCCRTLRASACLLTAKFDAESLSFRFIDSRAASIASSPIDKRWRTLGGDGRLSVSGSKLSKRLTCVSNGFILLNLSTISMLMEIMNTMCPSRSKTGRRVIMLLNSEPSLR